MGYDICAVCHCHRKAVLIPRQKLSKISNMFEDTHCQINLCLQKVQSRCLTVTRNTLALGRPICDIPSTVFKLYYSS